MRLLVNFDTNGVVTAQFLPFQAGIFCVCIVHRREFRREIRQPFTVCIKITKVKGKIIHAVLNAGNLAVVRIQLLECIAVIRFPRITVVHIITKCHRQCSCKLVPDIHFLQLIDDCIVPLLELVQVHALGPVNAIRHNDITERRHTRKILDQPAVVVRYIIKVLAHLA